MIFRESSQLGSLVRLAPVLTLSAVGCSLLVPLDYVGGAGGFQNGGSAGLAAGGYGGTGGSAEQGGTGLGAAGGTEGGTGGSGEAGGMDGGTSNGGVPDNGGMAGDPQAGDGGSAQGGTLGGTAGAESGGTAGLTAGGMGGTSGDGPLGGTGGAGRGGAGRGGAGRGGAGMAGAGMAGAGMAGAGMGGCGTVDFDTDRDHCGSCEIACEANEECLEGYCAASPCDGVCATFSSVTLAPGLGYKRENIGQGEVCAEVLGYDPSPELPSLVCWNFTPPRTLHLNGVPMICDFNGHEFDVPLRMGGYCVKVSPGQSDFAGFEFPG